MNGRGELLLLDTNIVIHLIRDNEVAKRVDASFHLRHRTDRPLISIVTVGECLSLVRQFGWGATKVEALEALLRELVIVPLDSRPILERFGEFHSWTKSIGRTLGHNDLWIAATASATGAHLITTDADFDPLHPTHIRRTIIAESA
ncbi:MAG TPA: type II toxin-antitoxin system VapC family toxin [Thermoanaerobaculia bacterium]|nr:type II toxin-antitoxin system VapC family toxin [Thermoanaerobaculia bacterium]